MSVLEKELEVSDLNFDFNKKDAVTELTKEFGQQFSISKSVREQHTDTTTIHTSKLPDGVVFAENEIDVKKTVEICQKYKCPIIPFGVGSSLEGHVNALYGGISIDLNNMNKNFTCIPRRWLCSSATRCYKRAVECVPKRYRTFFPN